MNRLRTVFMGSPVSACMLLDSVVSSGICDIAAVVTQPDRPKGRNLHVEPCDVKKKALEKGILVLDPVSINTDASIAALKALNPDLFIVLAYGQILKKNVLAIPRLGALNIHASILPKYRGAAPIQWAIANGETSTGVTAMFMNERMDAGDIIAVKAVDIENIDDSITLGAKLAQAGCAILPEAVSLIAGGGPVGRRQDDSAATYAPKLKKEDGLIDWNWSARKICSRVRAFTPWPCCYCITHLHGDKIFKIHKALPQDGNGVPGQVIRISESGVVIAAGEGAVSLLEVQVEGKKRISGRDWAMGFRIKQGMSII